MRTSMTYPMRFWAVVLIILLAFQFTTDASADWCKFEKDIDLTLDLSSSDILAITASAGDLDIVGVAGSDQAVIHGRACVRPGKMRPHFARNSCCLLFWRR